MWSLIKTELHYNKNLFLMLFILLPFVAFSIKFSSEDINIMYHLLPFLIINGINSANLKEKRESHNILMPFSARQVAFSRLFLLIIFPGGITLAVFSLVHFLINPLPVQLLVLLGMVFLFYLLFSIKRDLYYRFAKKPKRDFTKAIYMVLVIAATAGLLMGIIIFITSKEGGSGEKPFLLTMISGLFDFLFSVRGGITLYAVNILLSILSIETFVRRKSYIS